MMHVFYSNKYCDTSVAWDTTRKASFVADALLNGVVDDIKVIDPDPVDNIQLLEVIEEGYLKSLKTGAPGSLASSNGIGWDARLLDAVRSSTGGVCAAAMEAVLKKTNTGSLSSGLHHARATNGAGFCTVNGLALAAKTVLRETSGRVLVLDLDAHPGGGTASYADRPGFLGLEQVDVSLIKYDTYTSRSRFELVISKPTTYLSDIESALHAVVSPSTYDLVIYNAGMDAHESAGGLKGVDDEIIAAREDIVFSWAKSHGVPVAWVLAGGYTTGCTMKDLVELHLLTVAAAARYNQL